MAITNFIPTIWSEMLMQELSNQYIGVAHCNRNYEGDIREKGSVVRICGLNPINVMNYTKNANMNAPATLSDKFCELTINQAKYFNFQIDDVDRAQASPALMELAIKNAANALANEADKHIFELYEGADTTVTSTGVDVDSILSDLVNARTELYKGNVFDNNDVVIEVSPAVASVILKAKMKYATDNTPAMEKGCIGSVGGCKVYVSNNIQTIEDEDENEYHLCFVRSKRAIAFAEQLSEIVAYRPELRFADAVKGLHLYGAKVVYPKEFAVYKCNLDASEV